MITDTAVAKQILDELFEVSGRLDCSVAIVQDNSPEIDLVTYRRAIGRVLAELWDAAIDPILSMHPALTPPGLHRSR